MTQASSAFEKAVEGYGDAREVTPKWRNRVLAEQCLETAHEHLFAQYTTDIEAAVVAKDAEIQALETGVQIPHWIEGYVKGAVEAERAEGLVALAAKDARIKELEEALKQALFALENADALISGEINSEWGEHYTADYEILSSALRTTRAVLNQEQAS